MAQDPEIRLYLFPGFDRTLLPVPAERQRQWWQEDPKTRNHAEFCLPLVMANSLGYSIRSPGTFEVSWDGNHDGDAEVRIMESGPTVKIDTHSAHGSFTVQPGFIPMTANEGDFLFIKGIPNERGRPYQCMEALIEAWWNPATFGLVFLLHEACSFVIKKGDPIAQMFVFRAEAGNAQLVIGEGFPEEFPEWAERRYRPDYVRDLDYLGGKHPDGRREDSHRVSWRK